MIKINIRKKLLLAEGYRDLEINTEIEDNSVTTLYGKSGAGKTTLLRILAGLVQPEKGYIEVDGQVWLHTDKKINLPVQQRNIGFVFQDFALFPNMTVRQNLLYAARSKQDTAFVNQLLELVDLHSLADRKPSTLSGGQQQRAALIRALVRKPKILLLDEPLSALDVEMRIKLREEILLLHQKFNTTTLLVSHDLAEIYRISTHVIHIDQGKIIQSGTPYQVFGNGKASNNLHLIGEIISLQQNEVSCMVEVIVGNSLIKLLISSETAYEFTVGEKVIVSSNAFHAVMRKFNG